MKNNKLISLFLVSGMLLLTGCPPPEEEMEVATGIASEITATTAVVNGNIVSLGEGPVQYGHCYSTNPGPTVADAKTELGIPTGAVNFTSNLADLEPGTKYYVKGYLSDGNTAVYGKEIDFTTENWNKYSGNPVMQPGSATSWDAETVGLGSVIYYNNKYHMWYTGGKSFEYCKIGHATSDDGITWTKDPSNPVLDKGLTGSWEDYFVINPKVMVINNTFHMWYAGKKNKFSDGNSQIGHATSSDGTTWTKDANNPVLKMGSAGTWDNSWISTGEVLYDGTKYNMWYSGDDTLSAWIKIGHATSADALTWTKDPANPVLAAEGTGSWEYQRADNPAVLFDGTTYDMWYSGGSSIFNWKIGHATSTNGINWTKDTKNPVLSPGPVGSWESSSVAVMSVLDSAGVKYKMWYCGSKVNVSTCIGYAEKPHN